MARITTHEQFADRVSELVGSEYIVLTKYIKSSIHLQMRHNSETCNNHEYPVSPNVFLRGRRCPRCAEINKNSDKRKSHNEFVKEFNYSVGDEYILLGKYKNERTKIRVLHTVCNQHDDVTVRYFLKQGGSCKYCRNQANGDRNRKIHEDFVSEVNALVGNEYTVVGVYTTNKDKVEIRHNICGDTWYPNAGNFLRGSRCDHCFGKHQKTTEEFKKEVFDMVGNEYSVIGEYKKALVGIGMVHNECGFKWSPRPNDFLNNCSRCPVCSKLDSKGALKVVKFLEDNNIKFEREVRFDKCRHIKPLPFDFKINDVLIEYDGEQHFKENESWGGEEALIQTQLRDKIKDDYCRQNNIKLIRIPYWDYDNIEQILEQELELVKF